MIDRCTARHVRLIVAALGFLLFAGQLMGAALKREDLILMQGNASGSQTVEPQGGNSGRAEYSFNDRGRGDHIVATWSLDAAGVPTAYSGHGNDYMKVQVQETFHKTGVAASWRSRSEHGESAIAGELFYIPANPPPEFMGILARALLKAPGRKMALLPAGEAALAEAGSTSISDGAGRPVELTQYQIAGLDFGPTSVWLDRQGNTAALISGWMSVIPAAYAGSLSRLIDAQTASAGLLSEKLARQLTHVPRADLLIRHARLFDPRDLTTTPDMSILVRGPYILRVAKDADVNAPAGTEVIDAQGRFLMPGLWDNHQHFSANDGALDLANGVTSARDMANDTDDFLGRVARFDAGTELGPRVFKAGIIDGKGPLAGPTKMLVETSADAIRDVDWYADHGYGQIKVYSSVKPELVPIIADEAHAHGLRVSGHVPAFMTARQFVAAGADEIQHMNFIFLNFLADTVQDTRGMARFTAVAEHARDIDPAAPAVRDFIAFLRSHDTVLDPTLNVFEAMFCGDGAAVVPGLERIVPRFPPQVRRSLLSNALAVPTGADGQYREALPAMLRLLKALHDAGIRIIPGTDSLAGYTLHHELELYVRAGIPAPEVLRMATLTSAQVIGVDGQRGVIAAGRLADMILVDGDPAMRIDDIHRVSTVFKGGQVYDPAQIEKALGISPRPASGNGS